jgi:outer membrane protein OmpA-like peptidoglycan-associated protein
VAEDVDGVADDDGCPDLDDDEDGIADARDACPREREDLDQVADDDGCPEADGTEQGFTPVADCSGAVDAPSQRACRDLSDSETDEVVQTTGGGSVDFGRVEYAVGKGSALAASISTLLAVRSILHENPQILRTRIEGHSDDTGTLEDNLRLSRRRASAVARWLIERGIAAERLEVYACSDRYPREPAPKHKGLQTNRRVEFYVLEPAGAPHGHDECEPVTLR